MKRYAAALIALMIAGILSIVMIIATAIPAGASTWTTVRSVTQSDAAGKVIFADGTFDWLTPGESTYYYRSEPRVLQVGVGKCLKVSANGGTFWPTSDRNYELKDGVQYAVKIWWCYS